MKWGKKCYRCQDEFCLIKKKKHRRTLKIRIGIPSSTRTYTLINIQVCALCLDEMITLKN